MPILRHFNRNLFKKWSPEMAYVLGFIFADGTVFKNRRGAHFLEITSTDLEVIKGIRKIFDSNHKIGIRPAGLYGRKKVAYRLQIGSKDLLSDLLKLGVFQNKSRTVQFPVIPNKYEGDFVRGYFDGDGNVSFGHYFKKDRQKWAWFFSTRFTSGSKRFLTGLKKVLDKYIKGGFILNKSDRSGFDLVLSHKDSVALFKLMYNNVTSDLFLERKYSIFLKAFGILKYNVAGVA